jgi:hypothetical protein
VHSTDRTPVVRANFGNVHDAALIIASAFAQLDVAAWLIRAERDREPSHHRRASRRRPGGSGTLAPPGCPSPPSAAQMRSQWVKSASSARRAGSDGSLPGCWPGPVRLAVSYGGQQAGVDGVGERERDLLGKPSGRVGGHPLTESVADSLGVHATYQLVNKISTNSG